LILFEKNLHRELMELLDVLLTSWKYRYIYLGESYRFLKASGFPKF